MCVRAGGSACPTLVRWTYPCTSWPLFFLFLPGRVLTNPSCARSDHRPTLRRSQFPASRHFARWQISRLGRRDSQQREGRSPESRRFSSRTLRFIEAPSASPRTIAPSETQPGRTTASSRTCPTPNPRANCSCMLPQPGSGKTQKADLVEGCFERSALVARWQDRSLSCLWRTRPASLDQPKPPPRIPASSNLTFTSSASPWSMCNPGGLAADLTCRHVRL